MVELLCFKECFKQSIVYMDKVLSFQINSNW